MIRVAVDAFNLAADRRGMGRIVRQTLSALQRRDGVDVVLVAKNAAQASTLSTDYAGSIVTPAQLRALQHDAVWYPWNGMRFRPFAPSVVTINDVFAFTYPHRSAVARWREQTPIRRAVRLADRIVAISAWVAAEIATLFPQTRDRITVIPPAIDPFWHPVTPARADAYVLFVAGPDERKNAALAFDAFDAAFAREERAPVLVVAGTLNERDEQRFCAMSARRERCTPDDETLRALYSGALAVLVPSLAEGYGMPVVEAMACGAPVLASDASALPESSGGAAMLLAPTDVRAWTEALRRVAADGALRASLREAGLRRAAAIDPGAPASALLACVRQAHEARR